MAGFFIYSFNWDALQSHLAPPATALAEKVAKRLPLDEDDEEWELLPRERKKLVAYLASLFSSDDWHTGKSIEELQLIEQLVCEIFDTDLKLKGLQLTPPPDSVYFDAVQVAQGDFQVDTTRSTKRRTCLKRTAGGAPPTQELRSFGQRPFRSPAWDPDAFAADERAKNPFEAIARPFYRPGYSIHSPAQVMTLLSELNAARTRVAVSPELLEQYESFLVAPIQAAAERGHALYVATDT